MNANQKVNVYEQISKNLLNIPIPIGNSYHHVFFSVTIGTTYNLYQLLQILTFDVSNTLTEMIISFGSKETKKIWEGEWVKGIAAELQELTRRKLRMLNNSQNIADLKIPPSNRLEKLKGNYKDYYSIRVNDQWRIIFIWNKGNASEVTIIDYH